MIDRPTVVTSLDHEQIAILRELIRLIDEDNIVSYVGFDYEARSPERFQVKFEFGATLDPDTYTKLMNRLRQIASERFR